MAPKVSDSRDLLTLPLGAGIDPAGDQAARLLPARGAGVAWRMAISVSSMSDPRYRGFERDGASIENSTRADLGTDIQKPPKYPSTPTKTVLSTDRDRRQPTSAVTRRWLKGNELRSFSHVVGRHWKQSDLRGLAKWCRKEDSNP